MEPANAININTRINKRLNVNNAIDHGIIIFHIKNNTFFFSLKSNKCIDYDEFLCTECKLETMIL